MPVATATAGFRPHLTVRLRQLTLHDARRALAEAIARQTAAEAALAEATRAVALRQDAAMRSTSDEDVDTFAAWLPAGRQAVRNAAARATAAAAATAGARAAQSLARAALLAEAGTPHREPLCPPSPGCGPHPDER